MAKVFFLKKGKSYFVIDGLYIQDVKNEIYQLDPHSLEEEIRHKVFAFPKTDSPFVVISVPKGEGLIPLPVSNIQKADFEDEGVNCLDTDTGLLMVIEKSIMVDVIQSFDYNELVDSITHPINMSYWNALYKKYEGNVIDSITLLTSEQQGSLEREIKKVSRTTTLLRSQY